MAKKALKERLEKKKAELKSKGGQGAIYFQKPDTTVRLRILNMGEEEEFVKEVTQFYLGSEIKGVISPDTFGEPCAIVEAFEELKNSDDDDDKELAGKFPPRKRYLAYCIFYKDLKGKEVDENISPKFILLTSGQYQDILELYLDDDEWGDMTDLEDGYDLKLGRTGSGKTDTEYTVNPCKPTRIPKEYKKVYDLDEEVRKVIPTYEETEKYIAQYLGIDNEDEEDEDDESKPRRKRSSSRTSGGTRKASNKKSRSTRKKARSTRKKKSDLDE